MLSATMTPANLSRFVSKTAAFIECHQLPSGAIPWYRNAVTDPWDHVACAIALDLCGRYQVAAAAYRWLANTQNADGSWWYTYLDGQPKDLAKDSNHSAYPATGVWHHYLVTGDRDFLEEMWPMVSRGLDFTIGLQRPEGHVYWARDEHNNVWPSALLACGSSIWQSLINGGRIATVLGHDRPDWKLAGARLATAIRDRPELFDTAGDNERGYSMNWYYPVLTGVLTGVEARLRLARQWPEFIMDGWGCKCSLDQPWVTVAETCELAAALVTTGDHAPANRLLEWILHLQNTDGGFWTGISVPTEEIYPPDHETTWTAAAVIIAALADSESAGGSRLLGHEGNGA